MNRPTLIWAAGIGTLVVVNGVILNPRGDGSTFSECIRLIYRTDTRLGRCALIGSWAALTSWVLPHWCRQQ